MSKKALIVVTSHDQLGTTSRKTGYYLPEVAHPYLVLADAGYDIDVVSPKGGLAPLDQGSLDLSDPDNRRFWETPELRAKVEHTRRPDQVDPADYDAIVYAGGHGTMWDFPDDAGLQKLGSAIYEQGGVVAAVCHGPAALVNLKLSDGTYLVAGKTVAAFTDEEEEAAHLVTVVPFLLASTLVSRGARHVKAPNFQPKVASDQRLVTGQNPSSAKALGEAVVAALESIPARTA
jgi:putative intracellular protease/amidase